MTTTDTAAGPTIALGASGGADGAHPRALVIEVPLPCPLLTTNFVRRHHWRVRQRHTTEQRQAALLATYAALADRPGTLRGPGAWGGPVRVAARFAPLKGQRRPDHGALHEALKPIIDGIAEALGANDRDWLHGDLTWEDQDRTGTLTITLTEVAE